MNRAFWLEEALDADPDVAPPLQGDDRADVAIVGGGFTGLWTAIRLKEQDPGLDVAIVERDVCGGGASGRNGGFVTSWWAKYLSLANICGNEESRRLAQASEDALDDIEAIDRDGDLGIAFRRDGWLWTATSEAQRGAWETLIDSLEKHQVHPFRPLSAEEVADRSGTSRTLAGVLEPSCATVQPAMLARGLRRKALSLGVRIFEGSPMTRLDRARPPVVRTDQGTLTATKVVLAMNAWGARFPELRRAIFVVASDIIATAAAPERLTKIGLTSGVAVSDSRMFMNYYRNTPDGRVVWGKALGKVAFGGRVDDRFDGPTPRAAEVEENFRALYPMLQGVPITHNWMGPIDRTMDGLPFFGHLGGHPQILFGIGFSGQGVGPTAVGGRILASLVLERDDEWSNSGLVRGPGKLFPSEPARYVGGHMVIGALRRKETNEDAGRGSGWVTRQLADLAPAGFAPKKNRL